MLGIGKLIYTTVFELQFYDKQGYYWLLFAGYIFAVLYERNLYIKVLFSWGIMADMLASFMTHGDTQGIYALPAIIATLLMLFRLEFIKNKLSQFRVVIAFACIFFMIFSKDIILISNTTHGQETVFNQKLEYISCGPAKGAWERKTDSIKYYEIYNWITKNIDSEAKVCYFGRNVLLYLMNTTIRTAVPQQFMDYSDDTVLPDYYEQYPDEEPDLVILDVSPTSKRLIIGNEKKILDDYVLIYQSKNYEIYKKLTVETK